MTISSVILLLVVASVNGQGIIPGIDNRCFEPALSGVCRAFIPAFYFDPLSGSCDCFIYGGCQGNNNRFGTLEECQTTCSVRPELQFNTPACQRILGNKNPLASLTFSPNIPGATELRRPDTEPQPAQPESAQPQPAQPAQPQPTQPEPAQPQPTQPQPAQPQPAQPEPAQPQPAQTEAPKPQPTQPAQTEAPKPQPTQPATVSLPISGKGISGLIIDQVECAKEP
ncbi:cell division protein ZipA-like [Palaemon carinicauda]|uniref:cell division protein ZipA-like n=1 Tax=Palaemon carinicauda TaxID=392227 RepID=UPI0035B5D6EB